MKRILPWGTLLLGAVVLAIRFPSFPASWPIHWNASGTIDGWAEKSYLSACFPLLLAAGLTVFLELLVLAAGSVRRRALPEPWGERLVVANRGYIYYISTMLNGFLGYLACTLPFGPPPLAGIFLLVTAIIAYPAWDFARLTREMRAQGAIPAGYQGGPYSNPDDPRIWVPKLMGQGYTLNFAHRKARWMLAALVLLPVLISLFVIHRAAGG